MASLADGTSHVQQTVLHATAKQLAITTTSSNYQKLGYYAGRIPYKNLDAVTGEQKYEANETNQVTIRAHLFGTAELRVRRDLPEHSFRGVSGRRVPPVAPLGRQESGGRPAHGRSR
jgi:hypothetical protein